MKRYIMGIGDSPFSGTGFGEELRHIFFRLAQVADFEISWQSLQHVGYPIDIPDTTFSDIPHKRAKIKIYGSHGNPWHYGADAFLKNYRMINPEMVFFMGDPRNIKHYLGYKSRLGFPFVMYVTLDGLPIHPEWKPFLGNVNLLVAMTKWAQKEYKKVGLSPAMIHHGVNWKWWQVKEEEKYDIRRQYNIRDDVTIFVNWDIPQHRKRTDALLRCWKAFWKKKPKAKALLMLYTDWNLEQSMGWSIDGLIEQYRVPRANIISPVQIQGAPKYWNAAETADQLKHIVSMGDIMPSCTSGEGFGKCGLEAMTMGIVPIITDYSACSEVHQKGSMLVPTYRGRAGRFRMDDKRRSVEGGIVDEEKFVESMIYLYEDENERRKLAKEARRWAKEFDYDKIIVPQWKALLSSLDTDLLAAKELLNL